MSSLNDRYTLLADAISDLSVIADKVGQACHEKNETFFSLLTDQLRVANRIVAAIRDLQVEDARTEAKIKRLREALSLYADPEKWYMSENVEWEFACGRGSAWEAAKEALDGTED